MAYQLSEILERTRQDPAEFLAECDAAYQQRLETAADAIAGWRPALLCCSPALPGRARPPRP